MDIHTPLIRFTEVSFAWPDPDTGIIPVEKNGFLKKPIFDMFSAEIPSGFISLVGPNGSGKTTFMLLAGARIMPIKGRVDVAGRNSRIVSGMWSDSSGKPGQGLTPEVEHARNLVCSFIYQNMEFESQDSESSNVGDLLEFVFMNGGHPSKNAILFSETIKAMELEKIQTRKLDALSKGEIQRVLLGFSALYGSEIVMMDEPVFAMEHRQKERALDFFKNLTRETGVSVVVSLHELSLTRAYADTVLLFYPDRRIDMGTSDEVLTNQALEDSYGVPAGMLYDAEKMQRSVLSERFEILKKNED